LASSLLLNVALISRRRLVEYFPDGPSVMLANSTSTGRGRDHQHGAPLTQSHAVSCAGSCSDPKFRSHRATRYRRL